MKTRHPICLVGAVVFAITGLGASLQARFSLHTIDTMAITDLKPAGRAFQVPSAEHPIYYEAVNVAVNWKQGTLEAGDIAPDAKVMQDQIVRALARNHYLSADAAHPATEYIVMAWGTLYSSPWDTTGVWYRRAVRILAGDKYMDWGDPSEEGSFANMGAIIPRRVIPALSQSKLHNFAEGNCYYAEVRGYSSADAARGRASEIWETRIACPSAGLVMSTTLPVMIQLAAPHIGLETKRAMFATPEKGLHESYEFGEIKPVDDIDVNAARVTPIEALLKPVSTRTKKSKGTSK